MRLCTLLLMLCLALTSSGRPFRLGSRSGSRTTSTSRASRSIVAAADEEPTASAHSPPRLCRCLLRSHASAAGSSSGGSVSVGCASLPVSWGTEQLRKLLEGNATRHLIAGAAAGVVSTTALAPLEALRINLMISKQQTGIVRVMRQIYAQGGVPAFWRGNSADVLRSVPASAVRFCSFATYKEMLPACLASVGVHAQAATSLLAGGFAGMTSMALLYPLETVRTQMAASGALQGISMLAFSSSLLSSQGMSGFYRGLPASLISVMPFFAVRFGVYDMLKRWHVQISGGTDMPSQFGAAYGFASAIAATACTFPFEMVRRRAMVGEASSNLIKEFPAIVRTEGFWGLYKGYRVNVLKVAPSSAVTFWVYEAVRNVLDNLAGDRLPEATVLTEGK